MTVSQLVMAYPFTPRVVREVVAAWRVGAYVLGHCDGDFVPGYIGRSDRSLRERLADHPLCGQFDYFVLRYAINAANAYVAECELWHGSTQSGYCIENRIHPASPRDTGLVCPYCEFANRVAESWHAA